MPYFSAIKIRQQQQGSVLIVSLIILLVLTLIGITGMRTTVLEGKMASNSFDKNTAFQAAEAALRDGENLAETYVATGSFDGTNGKLGPSDSDPDWWDSTLWDPANSTSIAYSGTLSDVKTQPRYILKYVGQVTNTSGSLKVHGYGTHNTSTVNEFRVTARGTGKSDSSQVILQTYYGKNL
jgi:type IV pilus assembly protein PilX